MFRGLSRISSSDSEGEDARAHNICHYVVRADADGRWQISIHEGRELNSHDVEWRFVLLSSCARRMYNKGNNCLMASCVWEVAGQIPNFTGTHVGAKLIRGQFSRRDWQTWAGGRWSGVLLRPSPFGRYKWPPTTPALRRLSGRRSVGRRSVGRSVCA